MSPNQPNRPRRRAPLRPADISTTTADEVRRARDRARAAASAAASALDDLLGGGPDRTRDPGDDTVGRPPGPASTPGPTESERRPVRPPPVVPVAREPSPDDAWMAEDDTDLDDVLGPRAGAGEMEWAPERRRFWRRRPPAGDAATSAGTGDDGRSAEHGERAGGGDGGCRGGPVGR